jgi:hypothetical protein
MMAQMSLVSLALKVEVLSALGEEGAVVSSMVVLVVL